MNIDEIYRTYRAQPRERTAAFSEPSWREGSKQERCNAPQPCREVGRENVPNVSQPRRIDSDAQERMLLLLLAALLMSERCDPLLIATLLYLAL